MYKILLLVLVSVPMYGMQYSLQDLIKKLPPEDECFAIEREEGTEFTMGFNDVKIIMRHLGINDLKRTCPIKGCNRSFEKPRAVMRHMLSAKHLGAHIYCRKRKVELPYYVFRDHRSSCRVCNRKTGKETECSFYPKRPLTLKFAKKMREDGTKRWHYVPQGD